MTGFGRFLQITGMIVAPLGMFHFFSAQDVFSEKSLMTWELGLLAVGAGLFLFGRRLTAGS